MFEVTEGAFTKKADGRAGGMRTSVPAKGRTEWKTRHGKTNGRKGKVKVGHRGGNGHDRGKVGRGWGRREKYRI